MTIAGDFTLMGSQWIDRRRVRRLGCWPSVRSLVNHATKAIGCDLEPTKLKAGGVCVITTKTVTFSVVSEAENFLSGTL
jgi:hypothetical protein